MKEPGLFGGNNDKALRMAQEGIEIGQNEFYIVRADIYLMRGEEAAAIADYDKSMEVGVFKINAFTRAVHLALSMKDTARAKAYAEYAVRCRPDSPKSFVALGDYWTAAGDKQAAAGAYEAALDRDPDHAEAMEKLAELESRR